jgi:hypothetical protein
MSDTRRSARTALAIVAVTVAIALPLIVAVIALSGRRWYPVLDLAMTELRIRDVGGRFTPLIGLPGRIGTFPDQGSHPGPLSFWLLAPWYRIFGSSAWAMEAATVVLQLAWIALALWIGRRRVGSAGLAVVALVIALLIRGYGLSVLTQPWNPYLPLLAFLVVLLATWSVLDGDHMMLIVLVVAASFCAQTHIPYLLMAGGLGVFATAVVVVRCWRSSDRAAFRAPLGWTTGLFVVLWLGPLADQLRHHPGNIRRIIDYFGSPSESPIGVRRGVSLLLRHLDVIDAYTRWSTGGFGRFLLVGFEPTGTIVPGLIVLVIWLAAFAGAVKLRHRSLVALHTTIAATLVLSLMSMVRIFGKIWYYLTLWAWATTTLMLVAIVWTLAVALRTRRPTVSLHRIGTISAVVLAVVVTVPMVVIAPGTKHPEEELGDPLGALVGPTVAALEAGVGSADGPGGRYVVRWTDAYHFGSQGYGLVSELERAGLDAGVYDTWRVPVTAHRVIPYDQTTAEVILATGGYVEQWRADDRVVEVASVDLRSPKERAEFDERRRSLLAELENTKLTDLIPLVDTNLFGVALDPRLSRRAAIDTQRLLYLGQETAVFIGPPGVTP